MTNDPKTTLAPSLRFPEFRNGSAWEPTMLGDEGEFLSSLTGKSAEHFGVGNARYVTYMNVFSNTFTDMTSLGGVSVETDESQNQIAFGDLLLTISSETPEDAGMSSVVLDAMPNCYLNSFCTIFRFAEQKRPNPKFLGYLMRQPLVRSWLAERAQGSTRFNLSKAAFRSLPIALPSSAEQQKIAECLSTLDELIGAESQKLGALKAHKKGLMQQLFPREGETLPRLRFSEFENAPEWKSDLLGEIFDTASGGTPSRAEKTYWNGSIPWITTSLVDFRVIADAEEFITEAGLENSSAKLFPKGAVLMAMYGQGKTRGQVSLLGIDAATNQACAAILPRGGIDPYFVFLNLAGRYEEIRGMSNPGGQENLSQELVRKIRFAFPQEEDEQRKVTACLYSLDELIAAQSDRLEALKTHKKGLMQQLFPSPSKTFT